MVLFIAVTIFNRWLSHLKRMYTERFFATIPSLFIQLFRMCLIFRATFVHRLRGYVIQVVNLKPPSPCPAWFPREPNYFDDLSNDCSVGAVNSLYSLFNHQVSDYHLTRSSGKASFTNRLRLATKACLSDINDLSISSFSVAILAKE
jgi:hypothetical protein